MILSLLDDDDDQMNRVSSKLLTRFCFFFNDFLFSLYQKSTKLEKN